MGEVAMKLLLSITPKLHRMGLRSDSVPAAELIEFDSGQHVCSDWMQTRLRAIAALAIRSPPKQICRSSILAGCWMENT